MRVLALTLAGVVLLIWAAAFVGARMAQGQDIGETIPYVTYCKTEADARALAAKASEEGAQGYWETVMSPDSTCYDIRLMPPPGNQLRRGEVLDFLLKDQTTSDCAGFHILVVDTRTGGPPVYVFHMHQAPQPACPAAGQRT